jgi:N-acetylmuramoyl-L-alanine amidase
MKYLILPLFIIFVAACSVNPYSKTNRSYKKQVKAFSKELRKTPAVDSINPPKYFVGTTNLSMRKPSFVIIHHTAQNSCDQTLKTFTLPKSQVSAHYVICKDGTIHHLLSDYLRAWHGGVSRWGNMTDINSASIGIELDNDGKEPFAEPQLNSLIRLLDTLKRKYNIPAENFIGHADIAPTRKQDPNIYFPWKLLADRGFGVWYRDTTGLQVPDNFDYKIGLRLIGYDVRDSIAAIKSFKRHFEQDTLPCVTDADKKIIYALQQN